MYKKIVFCFLILLGLHNNLKFPHFSGASCIIRIYNSLRFHSIAFLAGKSRRSLHSYRYKEASNRIHKSPTSNTQIPNSITSIGITDTKCCVSAPARTPPMSPLWRRQRAVTKNHITSRGENPVSISNYN